MEKYIRKIGLNSIVISLLLIVLALFMIIKPLGTVNVLMLILGYILIVDGLIHFISYFSIKTEYRFFSYELAQSILYILLGLIIVYNSNTITTALPIFLGIWIVIEGIFRIQIAFNLSDVRNVQWGIMLIMSMIEVLLGIILIINPFPSLEILTIVSGIMLLISQFIDIYDDVFIINQVGRVGDIMKNASGISAEIIIDDNDDSNNDEEDSSDKKSSK